MTFYIADSINGATKLCHAANQNVLFSLNYDMLFIYYLVFFFCFSCRCLASLSACLSFLSFLIHFFLLLIRSLFCSWKIFNSISSLLFCIFVSFHFQWWLWIGLLPITSLFNSFQSFVPFVRLVGWSVRLFVSVLISWNSIAVTSRDWF